MTQVESKTQRHWPCYCGGGVEESCDPEDWGRPRTVIQQRAGKGESRLQLISVHVCTQRPSQISALQVQHPVGQLTEYMLMTGCRYAMLSSYCVTWFVRGREVGSFAVDHICKSLLTCLGITLSLSRWYDNHLHSR